MITREIINKNIKFHDVILNPDKSVSIETFDFNHLSNEIDRYKNILVSIGAVKGSTVVIGEVISLAQTAMIFACAELGIIITVIDNPWKTQNNGHFLNTKLKLVLPINYMMTEKEDYTFTNAKTKFFADIVTKPVIAEKYESDYTHNPAILAEPEALCLKCTSSGTTGEPKLITHNHKFMSELIIRNSKMFYGSAAIIANLNHGSSFATYFLPCLASEKVTDFYHIPKMTFDSADLPLVFKHLRSKSINIDHVMFPYIKAIDGFLAHDSEQPECILYTLGYIKKEWFQFIGTKIKDVISIFGTNETSGPLFINQATDPDFDDISYKTLDSFYDIRLNEKNELLVYMPHYNKIVETGDIFEFKDSKYFFMRRNFIPRINDLEVDIDKYTAWLNERCKAELVIDVYKNLIYLVFWKEKKQDVLNELDHMMREDSDGLHFINKVDTLDPNDFYTGIKLDKQLLIDHFRQKNWIIMSGN